VGSIERIIHQDYTILIKAVGEFLFCYVIRGHTYSAIQRLDTFVDTVRASTMWNELVGAPYRVKAEYSKILERISSDLFEGELVLRDEEERDRDESAEKDSEYIEVPKELLDYKFLLNPIRLSIVKVLDTYFRYPAAELRKLLHIPWGTFNDHVEALSKKGYIETKKEFIDQNALNVLYFTSSGASEYSTLKGLLQTHITG
jgi:DNA-binding MarR family transcriptional regulator